MSTCWYELISFIFKTTYLPTLKSKQEGRAARDINTYHRNHSIRTVWRGKNKWNRVGTLKQILECTRTQYMTKVAPQPNLERVGCLVDGAGESTSHGIGRRPPNGVKT